MRDIIIKRNELRNNSIQMRSLKFEDTLKNEQTDKLIQEQRKIYDKWNFYDKFIKAREEEKNATKLDNVGKKE